LKTKGIWYEVKFNQNLTWDITARGFRGEEDESQGKVLQKNNLDDEICNTMINDEASTLYGLNPFKSKVKDHSFNLLLTDILLFLSSNILEELLKHTVVWIGDTGATVHSIFYAAHCKHKMATGVS
jgi:hypothetical protein